MEIISDTTSEPEKKNNLNVELPRLVDYEISLLQYRVSDWLIGLINNSFKKTEHYDYWKHMTYFIVMDLNEDIKSFIKQLTRKEFVCCGFITVMRYQDLEYSVTINEKEWYNRLSDITIEICKQLYDSPAASVCEGDEHEKIDS